MKKAASILIITIILVAGMVLPSFAHYSSQNNPYTYWVKFTFSNGMDWTIYSTKPCEYTWTGSLSQFTIKHNGVDFNYNYYLHNGSAYRNPATICTNDVSVLSAGSPVTTISANYTIGSYSNESISYLWGVDSGFNCENSYAQFRNFTLDLTVNTEGYQAGELTFKQYVQRQTSNGWMTLNVESPVSIQANLGIGKSNKIPLWSIIPYKAGTYRYIVNAYKNGVIVSGGSTNKQFELITAPTWTTVTTGSAVTMGQLTITPVAERPVQILSPDDESSWTDEVHVMLGVFGVKNGSIHVQGVDETSVVLWTINPSDTADYTGVPYQLNGIRGDTYFTCDKPLPAGNGECFVYVTGGTSSQVETPYYQVEEDGRWWHIIDIVKIFTKPTVESGRGSDYWWDKDSGNYIEDPFDLDKIVDSVTNFVGGFAGFFTLVQASITYIPASIFGLGVFGATMTLILVLFRRA